MHYGERFALEGLLATLKPALSIEIGRAEGGSLRRIAAHSGHVHSFDLVREPSSRSVELDNVTFHTGDSSVAAAGVLAGWRPAGQTVDFALVDGDHSADGVTRDAGRCSPLPRAARPRSCSTTPPTTMFARGLDAVGFRRHPNVALSMLDFVPGYVVEHGRVSRCRSGTASASWSSTKSATGPPIIEPYRYDSAALQRRMRDMMAAEHGREAPPSAGEGSAATCAATA